MGIGGEVYSVKGEQHQTKRLAGRFSSWTGVYVSRLIVDRMKVPQHNERSTASVCVCVRVCRAGWNKYVQEHARWKWWWYCLMSTECADSVDLIVVVT